VRVPGGNPTFVHKNVDRYGMPGEPFIQGFPREFPASFTLIGVVPSLDAREGILTRFSWLFLARWLLEIEIRMTLRSIRGSACRMAGIVMLCAGSFAVGQSASYNLYPVQDTEVLIADADLPDAPAPQQSQTPATPPATTGSGQQPAPNNKTQEQTAEDQLKQQEHQRVLGIVPNFNTSYVYGAAPLTPKQKFQLAFRSEIDPAAFGIAGFVALLEQAEGSHYSYGGGWGGYAKRYGQSYADSFDGQMIGNALLPVILHQDPRYFRLGRGPVKRRILYALGTNFMAHHDGTGRWEPNYSNILGNFAAGGISNLYLPENERGFSSTITGGLVVIAEGGAGSMFQEFWPDICRHFLHKDPTHGQDAINAMKPDPMGGLPLFHNPPKTPKPEN